MISFKVVHLPGTTPYAVAHRQQRELTAQIKSGDHPDTLLLLEHDPVITLGRNAHADGVLVSEAELHRRGIALHRVERGGQATYHCPGQLVGYPIMNLRRRQIGAAAYIARLESVMMEAFALMDLITHRIPSRNGVFASVPGAPKVGALGVRISTGIAWHGFAMNISPNLAGFQLIVPCGLSDVSVSSLRALTGTGDVASARAIVESSFRRAFQFD